MSSCSQAGGSVRGPSTSIDKVCTKFSFSYPSFLPLLVLWYSGMIVAFFPGAPNHEDPFSLSSFHMFKAGYSSLALNGLLKPSEMNRTHTQYAVSTLQTSARRVSPTDTPERKFELVRTWTSREEIIDNIIGWYHRINWRYKLSVCWRTRSRATSFICIRHSGWHEKISIWDHYNPCQQCANRIIEPTHQGGK